MGIGPIPWRDIAYYGERCELEPDVQEAFVQIIIAMDCAYLKWQAAEQEKLKKAANPE